MSEPRPLARHLCSTSPAAPPTNIASTTSSNHQHCLLSPLLARIFGIAQQLSHTPSLLHHDNHPSGPAQRATTRLPVPAAPRPKPRGVVLVVVETVAASPSASRGDEREEVLSRPRLIRGMLQSEPLISAADRVPYVHASIQAKNSFSDTASAATRRSEAGQHVHRCPSPLGRRHSQTTVASKGHATLR